MERFPPSDKGGEILSCEMLPSCPELTLAGCALISNAACKGSRSINFWWRGGGRPMGRSQAEAPAEGQQQERRQRPARRQSAQALMIVRRLDGRTGHRF